MRRLRNHIPAQPGQVLSTQGVHYRDDGWISDQGRPNGICQLRRQHASLPRKSASVKIACFTEESFGASENGLDRTLSHSVPHYNITVLLKYLLYRRCFIVHEPCSRFYLNLSG